MRYQHISKMTPGVWSLILAISGFIMGNLYTTLLYTEFDLKFILPDIVMMIFFALQFCGVGLSFVALFLSCYTVVKSWKAKLRREVLFAVLGIVFSLYVVKPVILMIILAFSIGINGPSRF